MNGRDAKDRLESLERALERFDEALRVPETAPLAVDGTIQRFEFAFELCWKAMRGVLELQTSTAKLGTAMSVIKTAYRAGWIDDEQGWIDLLRMRNETSHVYDEQMAQRIYGEIRAKAHLLSNAARELRAQLP